MENVVYVVMHANYSDWYIIGYFTNLDDAERYVLADHEDQTLIIEKVYPCEIDGLPNIKPKYEISVLFHKQENSGSWLINDSYDEELPDFYQAEYLRSNKIHIGCGRDWIRIYVNQDKRDKPIAIKTAQDILYQYLNECDGRPSEKTVNEFNKILSAEEDERKERMKQEKLRQKELSELERLKEKYEGEI